jgi:phosphatidylserine/phosphatidylglycerophosphate/cardiolipin synthase-like enzyme
MTVDGVVANIGSANLNARSTELDEAILPGRRKDRSMSRRTLERAAGIFRHEI